MNFDLNLGGGAQPTLMLMNLAGYDGSPVIYSKNQYYKETADTIFIDDINSEGIFNHGFGSKVATKPTVVSNFRFGNEVYK